MYKLRCILYSGDVGGFMGLLLGGSVISLCEFLDLILHNLCRRMCGKTQRSEQAKKDSAPTRGPIVHQEEEQLKNTKDTWNAVIQNSTECSEDDNVLAYMYISIQDCDIWPRLSKPIQVIPFFFTWIKIKVNKIVSV